MGWQTRPVVVRCELAGLWLFLAVVLMVVGLWLRFSPTFSTLMELLRGPPSDLQAAIVMLVATAIACFTLAVLAAVGFLTASRERVIFQVQ